MTVAEARIRLDAAERCYLFASGCCSRHSGDEFKKVTEDVLAYHRERVRQAREAWLAAMRGESSNEAIFQAVR